MRGNFAPGVNTYNNSIHLFCIQNQHIERDNLSTLHLGTKSAPQNIYIDNSSFLYRLSPANCNIKKSVPLTCIRTKKAFFPILLNSSFRFDLFYFQAMFTRILLPCSESISDFKAYSVFRSIPKFDLGLFYFQAYHSKFNSDWTYFIFILQIRC